MVEFREGLGGCHLHRCTGRPTLEGAAARARLRDLLDAVRDGALAGFCYTQLTDTGQETNGLLDADRQPKLPVETIRRTITG